jgi:hypothetical protein
MTHILRKAYLDRFGKDSLRLTADDIIDELPDGYRWATEEETYNWFDVHYTNMVQVVRGGTSDAPLTSLAIKE